MAAPSKAEQEAESKARNEAGIEPSTAQAIEGADHDSGAETGGQPPQRQARTPAANNEAERPAPSVKSKFDSRRNDIVSRFRANRTVDDEANRDDISDFAKSGLPPEFAAPVPALEDERTQPQDGEVEDAAADTGAAPGAADPAAEQQQQPAALPKTVKVKVFGQERELTLEEVVAHAQIAMASDGLLEASKTRIREADELLRSVKDKVARTDQPGQHQPGQERAQTDELQPAANGVEHHDTPIAKLIEAMQFGDPAEAAVLLENTIQQTSAKASAKAVVEALERSSLQDEGARTAKVLADFKAAHPELAADPLASAAIERRVYDIQLEDIKALGVDPKLLPTEIPGVLTPGDIATAHRWYRSKGFKVKSPQDMLERATADVLEWRGVKPTTTEPADPARKAQPRVDVSVDRTARRQAIPQQPSRTATPRPDARQQQPATRDRSQVVAEMANRRLAPRGKALTG